MQFPSPMKTGAAVLAVVSLAGCAGGPADATAPLMATGQLAGDFDAVVAVFADPIADREFDVISEAGQFELDIGRDGEFISTLVVPGRVVVTRSGTVVVSGEDMVVTEAGESVGRVVPFELDGSRLRFEDPGMSFDFDGDGVAERAVLSAELIR